MDPSSADSYKTKKDKKNKTKKNPTQLSSLTQTHCFLSWAFQIRQPYSFQPPLIAHHPGMVS